MSVLALNSVKDTSLWQHLRNNFLGNDKEVAETLANSLINICQEGYDRMKGFPSLHPEYTLHDEVHCLRVTELMYRIMPESVIARLNPVEVALLILSAHYHDQGMVLEAGEIDALNNNTEFRVFQDNWVINHPNLQNVKQILKDKNLSDDERKFYRKTEYELEAALLTDYVRKTHGQRSSDFVHYRYEKDPRWAVFETTLVEFVARLSLSHVKSAYDLTIGNGFRYDEVIGIHRVNMIYLGLILRLADILDFDRDRTPDSLYRTIDFRSKVSIGEWEKHRSVEGWIIEPTKVQYTMRCEHPEYQRAAYQFMDWIDKELADAQDINRSFPAEFADYKLELPQQVDRSRIEPKDQAYIYHDLEFSLSRDEIVKLLMTEKLYGSPSLCIRELLQNSLDALRHRKAQLKRDANADWNDGKVIFNHFLDEHGHENITCIDNGIGMDRDIILRFLTNAGRSYYRSPEFEQERVRFKHAGVDFDPCAQFGIGFMSCFMLGDRITIYTRRDYGLNGIGEPLVVEINGFNSMVVIRKGTNDQSVGTKVNIIGRKLPRGFEYRLDIVRLIDVLNGYALATEFLIEGSMIISDINISTNIPPHTATPLTTIERENIQSAITFEQDFSEIDPLLSGVIRTSFLTDDKGVISLENSEASWNVRTSNDYKEILLVLKKGNTYDDYDRRRGQTCIDGILVAGNPGREDQNLTHYIDYEINPIQLERSTFLLDIRGSIKPPLTPARTPDRNYSSSKWFYIEEMTLRAQGRVWEKVAEQLQSGLDDNIFWQTLIINAGRSFNINWMRAVAVWKLISVPILNNDETLEWTKISDLGRVLPKDYKLQFHNGGFIGFPENFERWVNISNRATLWRRLNNLVITMSTVVIKDGTLYLELRPPSDHNFIPAENHVSETIALSYDGGISDLFSAHFEFESTYYGSNNVNKSHPLVQLALNSRFQENKSVLEMFADNAVNCLSDPRQFELEKNSYFLRSQRNVGFLYEDIDWNGIADEFKPPYLIRTIEGEVLEITDEDFRSWATLKINQNE